MMGGAGSTPATDDTKVDPALLYEGSDVEGPGTHVLVIGMGTYTHLIGGVDPKVEVAEGLGQVPVAARSARKVAQWFLDSFENSEKPLASVSLVVSEPGPSEFEHARTGRRGPLPSGTVDELEHAVERWLERAERNENNLAIFYVCGHGMALGVDSLVLTRDFGRSSGLAFKGSVNLNGFMTLMRLRLPKEQLFLIDCCRVPTDLESKAPPHIKVGSDLIGLPGKGSPKREAKQSCQVAVGPNEEAYGDPNGLTFFTEALLAALDGGGGQADLAYRVGTAGLHTALCAYVDRLAREADVEQIPEVTRSKRFAIHRPRDIRIPIHVTCNPGSVFKRVRFEAKQGGRTLDFYDANSHGERDKWSTRQPMGTYVVEATLSAGDHWESALMDVILSPPEFPCHFDLKRRKE